MLPLGQSEKDRIQPIYQEALDKAEECTASLKQLLETLQASMACLDDSTKKKLQDQVSEACSTMFQIKIRNYKVSLSGFDRVFAAATQDKIS